MLSPAAKEKMLGMLFTPELGEPPREVFALLDGAMVRRLPDFLEDEEAEHAPLLPLLNEEPEEITRATYLTRVTRDSPVAAWLLSDGWGAKWGIWLSAAAGTEFDDILGHLRELAQVRLPDGRIVYFRYYDPRVWRTFVPTCDAAQLDHLFSLPIVYGCESEDGRALLIDFMKDSLIQRQENLLETLPEDDSRAA